MIKTEFFKSKIRAADVGAFGGIPEYWKPFLDQMLIEAFEPDKEECKKQSKLKSKNINWHPIGLAEETKLIPLYVLNRETGSSLFPPNEEILNRFNHYSYSGINKIIDIPCHSLSDLISKA